MPHSSAFMFLTGLLWGVLGVPSYAETKSVIPADDKTLIFETADTFADCAATYEVSALFAKKANNETAAYTTYKEQANGATMVGIWILFSTGMFQEYALAEGYIWNKINPLMVGKARYIREGENQEHGVFARMVELAEAAKKCQREYGAMQDEIITDMRLNVYSIAMPDKK